MTCRAYFRIAGSAILEGRGQALVVLHIFQHSQERWPRGRDLKDRRDLRDQERRSTRPLGPFGVFRAGAKKAPGKTGSQGGKGRQTLPGAIGTFSTPTPNRRRARHGLWSRRFDHLAAGRPLRRFEPCYFSRPRLLDPGGPLDSKRPAGLHAGRDRPAVRRDTTSGRSRCRPIHVDDGCTR